MNTLLLAPELFTSGGGITRVLRLYLKALCDLSAGNDTVRFVALNDRVVDSAELRRYSNGHLAAWEVCSGRRTVFIRAALRQGCKADRVICGHVAQLPLAWAASKLRPRLKYYLVAHGIEVWRPFTLLERLALRRAACIWCVSNYTRLQLLERCALPGSRVTVLPNALDPYMAPAGAVGPPGTAPLILCISRLSAADGYKGINHLIEAMPAVTSRVPGARLRIVGRGDALATLQALARRTGVADCVEFPGYVSDADLGGEFSRSRLFALPSEKEGFGLVYLEAMAHGRPSLGARAGGAPEVILHDTGVLADYGDVAGIAAAIVDVLGRDWPVGPLLARSREFSYLRFKDRLASLLAA